MKRTSKMTEALLFGVTLVFVLVFVGNAFVGDAKAQSCVQPPSGVVSWWPGNGNGSDIIDGNASTLLNGATFAAGKVGQAFSLDGIDDFVNVADNANLKFGATESFTIDAWIRTTKSATVQRIVSKQSEDSANHYFLRVQTTGIVKFQIGDNFPISGGFVEVLGTTPVNDGIFHHVAGVRDRTTNTVKFYVDGVLEATAPDTTTGPIDGGTNPLTIGTLFFMILGPQPEFFEGLIDEVEIYNRALSAAEIQAIFAAGSAGKCMPGVGAPVAIAGTSLNGNNMLQLDGTLSSDPQGDPLTFSWQIEGEATPRTGRIVSIADLPIGNYQLTLTVSDGIYTDTDTMIFGVPVGAGVAPPPVDVLQEQVQNTKDKISNFSISSFDAPNDKAAENRRKALLNMLDKVSEHIDTGDYQAAIDQLRDISGKTDGLQPPDSEPDWILGTDAQAIFQKVSDLIADLLLVCSECS